MKSYRNLPVGIIGTGLALCTLSNAYNTLGFSLVRTICMLIGMYIWFLAFNKIARNFDKVKEEYMSNTITATLYATFSMLTMVLASFIYDFIPLLGQMLWLIAIVIQSVLIIMLFALHIFKKRNLDVILPSWYVTLLGLLVSTAIGTSMGMPNLQKIIVIYGFIMYFCTILFVIYRLIKKDLPPAARYTKTILLAPISLIIVGYINVFVGMFEQVNVNLLIFLYVILLVTIIYITILFPGFLKGGFTPGWAALTFPMAIAVIASLKTQGFLINQGNETLGFIVNQIAGLQILVTTAVILFVLVSFFAKKDTWN